MTLEDYFRDALSKGQIDHALRVQIGDSGLPEFYIHPAHGSGHTLDLTVEGNVLRLRGRARAEESQCPDGLKGNVGCCGGPTGGATLTTGPEYVRIVGDINPH